MSETLYQRIGGEVAMSAAVERFYERVVADPELEHFFVGIAMPRLKAHQAAFLSQALGGPKHYSGNAMDAAHGGLTITQHHFDLVATHLVGTLGELGVSQDLIDDVAGAVTPLAAQIVNASSYGR